MKKFAFALQPVLEHRKRIEDEKQVVVAARKRAVDEAEAELSRLNDEFRTYAGTLRTEHAKLSTAELQSIYAHLQFVDRCTVAQMKVVADRRAALDRARAELLEASKQKKVVEKLKTRRKESYDQEAARLEQKELDDSNARRYGRTVIGGTP
jgi:flagellar protein FliJ